MPPVRYVLPVIVFSQFCGTSLWFAVNGVLSGITAHFDLPASAAGHLTTAILLGFIAGTLVFSLLTIPDRFAPSMVFFICSISAAIFNAMVIWPGNGFASLVILRFITGFFIAGIYPVGMKIAADYFNKGLGISLGFLVGALVLGTAFPHSLNGFFHEFRWQWALIVPSVLATSGGVLLLGLVPDGPYRKPYGGLDFTAFTRVFDNRRFRIASLGYFGHMWELYGFWTFLPFILTTYNSLHPGADFPVSSWSFIVIAMGGPACVAGGFIAQKAGTQFTAFGALALSGLCCLLCPLMILTNSGTMFLAFLVFWGMVVIADSPLFSTLVAQNARQEIKGTAITIVICMGFTITIISIQLLTFLQETVNPLYLFLILALGPLCGLTALISSYKSVKPEAAIS